jgi:hypothetical protein
VDVDVGINEDVGGKMRVEDANKDVRVTWACVERCFS